MMIYTRRQKIARWWDQHEGDIIFGLVLTATVLLLVPSLALLSLATPIGAGRLLLAFLLASGALGLSLSLMLVVMVFLIVQEAYDQVQYYRGRRWLQRRGR